MGQGHGVRERAAPCPPLDLLEGLLGWGVRKVWRGDSWAGITARASLPLGNLKRSIPSSSTVTLHDSRDNHSCVDLPAPY